jgi:hypothetical protein
MNMQRQETSSALNLRVGGRLAAELIRIANHEQNSVSAVARRLIMSALSDIRRDPTSAETAPPR